MENKEIHCNVCDEVFAGAPNENLPEIRNRAKAEGWVVGLPAWCFRPGDRPDPKRREKRQDRCKECAAEKHRTEYDDAMARHYIGQAERHLPAHVAAAAMQHVN